MSALVDAGQEAGSPIGGMSLRQTAPERVAHDHETREIAARRTQTVGSPGPGARVAHTG